MAYILDPDFFGSAVISTDLANLDLHGPHCANFPGPGEVLVRDHRPPSGPVEYRYT
ncbi:hypothetical protein [Actinoplanes solisilvae]|uniref:hypothetical protein n=1 Tax=Actinoplanes solisilvae TaxID=2486853 RepID=UPI0013E30A32|nr:hypothetical protein [Actinoplanes solisilvae]